MNRTISLLFACFMAFGGCLVDPVADSPTTAVNHARGPHRVIHGCDAGCWEPTVAIGSDGTVYATSAEGDILVLAPNATGFTLRDAPPLAVEGGFRGDITVYTNADRLYYTALTVDDVAAGLKSRAIEVHMSLDGGQTWAQSRYLGPRDGTPANPADTTILADRQWMFFSDAEAFLTFQRPLGVSAVAVGAYTSELVMSRAPIGTLDFGDWEAVTPTATRARPKITGQGIAADGAALLPLWMPSPNPMGESWGFWLARVDDTGIEYVDVGGESVGGWFPSITRVADGSFAAAWVAGGTGYVAFSPDARTWSAPEEVASDVVTSPWIVAWNRGIAIAYHEAQGDGTRLMIRAYANHTWSAPTEIAAGITGAFGRASNTDMAFLVSQENRLVTVWSSQKSGQLGVAIYGPHDL